MQNGYSNLKLVLMDSMGMISQIATGLVFSGTAGSPYLAHLVSKSGGTIFLNF